jgi:hypothetical protein
MDCGYPRILWIVPQSSPNDIQTPFKEILEALTHVMLPIPSYECFEFREEFLDRVQVRRIWWQVQ